MEDIVRDNSHRLELHPMFARVYGMHEDVVRNPVPPSSSSDHNPRPIPISKVPCDSSAAIASSKTDVFSGPPFDWNAIDQHLQSVDLLEREAKYETIIETLCLAIDDLTHRCKPATHKGKVSIANLALIIQQIDELADNMTAAFPCLIHRTVFTGDASAKLRECVNALCLAIAKHRVKDFVRELSKTTRQNLEARLWSIDAVLTEVDPRGSYDEAENWIVHVMGWFQ